jgi:hypothetical protein
MALMTVWQFRELYPSFTEALYPDFAVETRLALGEEFLSEKVWRKVSVRTHAVGLYTAHYLSAYGSASSGGSGKSEGSGMGVVSSKSVDGASISYDTGSTVEQGAGFWNSTPYGRELWQLMRVFGAGAIQL